MLASYMPRTLLALLGGTVLLLVALLWREHRRGEVLQTRLVETETRLARAMSIAARKSSAKFTESAANEAPVAPTPSPQTIGVPAVRTFSDAERNFRKHMDQQRRWNALAKKADLLAALNLPPDKRRVLKDMLVEREFAERDARDAAQATGVEPDETAAAEVAKIDARIQALLGDADYANYNEQMSIAMFREQLESSPIPGSLVDAGVPLAPAQKAWLAGVMYRAVRAQLTDRPVQSPDPNAARRALAATLLAEASGNLTPLQIAALSE
jgi:hypothetical protein